MPLNGPEALGWALAILVVSLVLGHAQATLLFSLYGGSFSLAAVMSCVMWGTFLGIPSWHGIFAAYQEYHIRLGRFRELRVRAAVTIEAREVSALPRNERLALPRWNPPSYQALEIRDLDLEADLDPVPPYPMTPQGYPMVLSEPFDLSVEETQELHPIVFACYKGGVISGLALFLILQRLLYPVWLRSYLPHRLPKEMMKDRT
ncbi:hypothetical protein PISMIDRAFT_9335 [Pisolithus microcarpus 441]|uniref:Uncharacterized protein n=1 Tax=Pisolithus microcarpus 441 TaxID=765257 RepID=A0A0C9YLD0_9AGAM|nr:hypothetical protein PISMIDRAFT_9335 [Pisolithus microcarpus 441]